MSKLPVACPSCENSLEVSELSCHACGTKISGNFSLPSLLLLPVEEQDFLFRFIRFSGSLKEMAKHLKKSYPTVRNKLDDILVKIDTLETGNNQSKKQ